MKERSTVKKGSIEYYLDLLGDRFYVLEAFSTAGDIRPPYPYQWVAYSTVEDGCEECFIGVGGTPLEAVKDLYKTIKDIL